MLEGLFWLLIFVLNLLFYPLRLYRKYKKKKRKPKSAAFYLPEKEPCKNLKYDYFGKESTAEIDLQDLEDEE
jgi:hypothetical protein